MSQISRAKAINITQHRLTGQTWTFAIVATASLLGNLVGLPLAEAAQAGDIICPAKLAIEAVSWFYLESTRRLGR